MQQHVMERNHTHCLRFSISNVHTVSLRAGATMDASNSSSCRSLSEQDVKVVINTKIATASLSFVACFVTFILICVLVCYMKVWKTFIHRLKLYLTAVALFLSIMYILQVLPVTTKEGDNGTETVTRSGDWSRACEAIAFLLQYTQWVMLLIICWMILFLLWLVYYLVQTEVKAVTLENNLRLEIGGIFFTLIFPLLFLWTPFVTQNYGLGGQWCGIVIKHSNGCSEKNESLLPGLGYQIGIWYGPAFVVAFLCTIGVIIVIHRLWLYYKENGRTEQMNNAIIKGIPPAAYLVLFNVINCINAASLVYHVLSNDESTNYHLWITHAITGPCRALAIPFAFVLSHLFIRCCFKKKRDSYYRIQ